MSRESSFLAMKSPPGKDAVKTAEMIVKDLEYDINIVDKAVTVFERIDYNLKFYCG